MHHTRGKLIAFAIMLVLSALACNIPIGTSVYDSGSVDMDICISMGGTWVYDEDGGVCLDPTLPATPFEELESESDSDISLMQPCIADLYLYRSEFAKEIDEDLNETKHICSGDLILRNTSNDMLDFKLYEIWDNGAMQQEGWDEDYYRLEPGEEFPLYFETQTWSDGRSTLATYTKIIVFRTSSTCAALLSDEVYKDLWDKIAIPLDDPCR